VSLVDHGEVTGSGRRYVPCAFGFDDTGEAGLNRASGIGGMEAIEVNLDRISLCQLRTRAGSGAKERGHRFRGGRMTLYGLDDKKVCVRREEYRGDPAVG